MIDICDYCNEAFCEECDGDQHTTQINGKCQKVRELDQDSEDINDDSTWEYKVLEETSTDGTRFIMTEHYSGMDSWAELLDAPTLDELEHQIASDLHHQLKAVERFRAET